MLNEKQAYFLLWVTLMSQGQRIDNVFRNVQELMERLNKLDIVSRKEIEKVFVQPKALHRFPNKMAGYVYEALLTIEAEFGGDVKKIFCGNEKRVVNNLLEFKGIGIHKANIGGKVYKMYTNKRIERNCIAENQLHCVSLERSILEEMGILRQMEG